MGNTGKQIRMSRFQYRASRFGLIVPLDHGLTIGPVDGLKNVSQISTWINHPSITGIIAHKGMVERLAARGLLRDLGVMVHLNGMSTLAHNPDQKERLTALESAIRLGADAVSVQVNFDGNNDAHNLGLLGSIVDEAQRYGLPVLTMLYDKLETADSRIRLQRLRHLMRIAIELGTDALKLAAPQNLEEVPFILDGLSQDIPIFFAGGSLCSDEHLFSLTERTIANGGAGLCAGRNIFQRTAPGEVLNQLQAMFLRADGRIEPLAALANRLKAIPIAIGAHHA